MSGHDTITWIGLQSDTRVECVVEICYDVVNMLTRASTPEDWQLLAKGTDPTTGEIVAHVGRRSYMGTVESVCIWRVAKRGGNWYNMGHWPSLVGGYRPSPEKNGQKLSCSWLHRAIVQVAEG